MNDNGNRKDESNNGDKGMLNITRREALMRFSSNLGHDTSASKFFFISLSESICIYLKYYFIIIDFVSHYLLLPFSLQYHCYRRHLSSVGGLSSLFKSSSLLRYLHDLHRCHHLSHRRHRLYHTGSTIRRPSKSTGKLSQSISRTRG